MKGITFLLECPYFCCFRKPTSTSTMTTYPVIPFTTLRGLVANAMGLQRNDFVLQDKMRIGISPLSSPFVFTELAKILKLKEGEKRDRPQVYPSSPMYKGITGYVVMVLVEVGFLKQQKYGHSSKKVIPFISITSYRLYRFFNSLIWSLDCAVFFTQNLFYISLIIQYPCNHPNIS